MVAHTALSGTAARRVTAWERMDNHATLRAEHNRRMAAHFRSFADEAHDETLRRRLLRLAARYDKQAVEAMQDSEQHAQERRLI